MLSKVQREPYAFLTLITLNCAIQLYALKAPLTTWSGIYVRMPATSITSCAVKTVRVENYMSRLATSDGDLTRYIVCVLVDRVILLTNWRQHKLSPMTQACREKNMQM